MLLREKRCLIVGGTGGAGLHAARRFLDEGALAVLAGRDPERGAAALKDLARPGRVYHVVCDPASAAEVDWLFRQAVALLGSLDVVLHTEEALSDVALHDCPDADWCAAEAAMTGAFLATRAAVRHFLPRGNGGVIVLVAPPTDSPSGVAHGAAATLVRACARYSGEGVRAHLLAPGLTDAAVFLCSDAARNLTGLALP